MLEKVQKYKIRFAVEKKNKNVFVSLSKLLLVIRFPYMGICMISIFLKNQKPRFSSPGCFNEIKQQPKLAYILFQPFFEFLRKLYDKLFSVHLVRSGSVGEVGSGGEVVTSPPLFQKVGCLRPTMIRAR